MHLNFLRLVISASAALTAPTTRGRTVANCDTRNQHPSSHHGIFVEDGGWNLYPGSDLSISHQNAIPKHKIVGRAITGGIMEDPVPSTDELSPKYIYEDPTDICSWCECPSTSMSNHACPADSDGYSCPKCSDECLNCSCGSSSDQPDHCSTECAKKCVSTPSCTDCSCASQASEVSNPGKLCDPSCHKCPVPGSDQPNQRCDLCPYLPCVDNLCPCFDWCRAGECNIYGENGEKNTDVCKGIETRCNKANYCINLSEDSLYSYKQPAFLSPNFNGETAPEMGPQVNNVVDQLARVSNFNHISADEPSKYLTPSTDTNQALDPSEANLGTI